MCTQNTHWVQLHELSIVIKLKDKATIQFVLDQSLDQ